MTTQLQKKPVIQQYLEKYKDQIAVALPRHMNADRMARIVLTEVRKVPKLMQCNPISLFGAVVQASQLGLEPGNALGQAYLIPYGKEVQLIIGYKGMIDLARRSGQIISIEARAVYKNDEFQYSFGLNPDLQHTPYDGDIKDRGEVTHFYSVARLKDGGVQWDVMKKSEVDQIRAQSRAGNNGPWKTHYDEMGKKTVIRRLFKFLPVSVEMQTAVGLDEMADSNVSQQNSAVIDGEFMEMEEDAGQRENARSSLDSLKTKLSKNETVDESTGEIIENKVTLEGVTAMMTQAANESNSDALDAACDLIDELPQADKAKARKKAAECRKDLG